MEQHTKIKLELDIAASKILQQLMLHNEHIEKEIAEGITNAFNRIDLKELVEQATSEAIKYEIKNSTNWGKLRALVSKKADEIVAEHIEKQMDEFKNRIGL